MDMSLISNYLYFADSSGITDIVQIVVDILNIVITAGISIWVVRTLQKKLNNERRLKDYFISEISAVQGEYRNLIASVLASKESPKLLKIKFSNLETKLNSLMQILEQKYDISHELLYQYQINLRMIIEDDPGYTSVFRVDSRFTLTPDSVMEIYALDRNNVHLFYDIIIKINSDGDSLQ